MLAAAVAKYLDVNEPGLVFDPTGVTGNVFIATMPASPDETVMLMPTGGRSQRTRQPDDLPSLQALVRGPRFDPRPGYATARAVYERLAGLDHIVLDPGGVDEIYVVGCTPVQSEPIGLGKDENDRHEWSLNFDFHTHAPTVHRT